MCIGFTLRYCLRFIAQHLGLIKRSYIFSYDLFQCCRLHQQAAVLQPYLAASDNYFYKQINFTLSFKTFLIQTMEVLLHSYVFRVVLSYIFAFIRTENFKPQFEIG